MIAVHSRRTRLLPQLVATALLAGCFGEPGPSAARPSAPADQREPRAPAFSPREVYTVGQVDDMDVSPRLELVATAEHSGRVLVWDWSTGRVVHELVKDEGLIAAPILVKFVEARDALVVVYNSGVARVWNLESGRLMERLSFDGYVSQADASAGGEEDLLVLTYTRGGHSVYSVNDTRTPVLRVEGDAYGQDRSALSAGGELFLHVSSDGPDTVRSVATGEVVQRLELPRQVMCAEFSPDGRWIATGNYVGQVDLWSVETGERLKALERRSVSPRNIADRGKRVEALCFTDDGTHLAALRGSSVSTWELGSGERAHHWELGSYTGGVRFAGGPDRLLAGTREAPTLLRASREPEPQILGAPRHLVRREPTIDANDSLFDAVRADDLEAFKELLERGADPDARDARGMTVLWTVAGTGRADFMEHLIEAAAEVDARSLAGATALWIAAQKGHAVIVRRLLEAGADPDLQDDLGGTALQWAASGGYGDVVRMLLDRGADVDLARKGIGGRTGGTALSMARDSGHADIVALLEAAGAKR